MVAAIYSASQGPADIHLHVALGLRRFMGAYLNLLLSLGINEALDGAPDQLEHSGRIDDAGVTQHLWVVVLVYSHDPPQHPLDVT